MPCQATLYLFLKKVSAHCRFILVVQGMLAEFTLCADQSSKNYFGQGEVKEFHFLKN